ncbi:MAG: FtsX-like permease family protein, partial [Planctomycetota bacterium]
SKVADGDVVRSTAQAGLGSLVIASVPGVAVASDEIHAGTSMSVPGFEGERAGFVRGVTRNAFDVHEAVTLVEGRVPGPGEAIVGRLVARQLGVPEGALGVGATLRFEGADFAVVGRFVAPGTTIEAEVWTPLEPLRGLTQRDDSSAVFVRLEDDRALKRLRLFADRRLDLELDVVTSEEYYGELSAYFRPIQRMAWFLACLVGFAALLGGANVMAAAVQDRVRELAALRAIGYSTWALARSLLVEALVLGAAGAVVGIVVARVAFTGGAVRLAMSAFELRLDGAATLTGLAGALLLALFSVVPASLRVARLPIARALSED